jgi:hypothetical protein
MTYDPTTDAGKVRLLITDTDTTDEIFTDAEINEFLNSLGGGSILLGAAFAIETIARSEVLVQKVIKLLDLTTDGSKVAAELRLSAESLRQQAAESGDIDWAENPVDVFSLREKIEKDAMRGLI